MGNHVIFKPTLKSLMYLSKDGKYVITETTITDKRPLSYYTGQLLKGVIKSR